MLEEEKQKRLTLLRDQGMYGGFSEEYRQMVLGSVQIEEMVYQQLTEYVCDYLGLDTQIFMDSQSELL